MSVEFATMHADNAVTVIAPDGSTVRPLCVLPDAASFARFELAPGQVSRAVSHATVQEIWYIVAGDGLCAVAVTIPPWPADRDEARFERGAW